MISNFDLAFEKACDVLGDVAKATEWMDKKAIL